MLIFAYAQIRRVEDTMRMKRFRGEGWALLGMIWALAWPTMLEQLMSTAVQ